MIDYISFITVAAKTAAVPPLLLLSVCFTESSFRDAYVPHDGKTPSYGVCQLKMSTARIYEPTITRRQLMNPYVNALIAGRFLRDLLERYDFNVKKAVDAYNRGKAKLVKGHSKYSDRVMLNFRRQPWNRKFPKIQVQ